MLLLPAVAHDRGFQAESEQSERHRQLVQVMPCQGRP